MNEDGIRWVYKRNGRCFEGKDSARDLVRLARPEVFTPTWTGEWEDAEQA